MKKIIFSVIIVSAAALTSCTKKVERIAVFKPLKTSIFSPKFLVGTAD